MTLIAAFGIETGPVFLTDGLLSSPEGRENIAIPSIGKLPSNIRVLDNRRVYATMRKTEIVTPNLIVAWAGNYAAAQRVLHEIRIFAHSVTDDADWIERHIRANCKDDLETVSLIVSTMRPEKGVSWSNNCQEFIAPGMKIWAQGSGRHRFGAALQQLDFPALSAMPPPNGGIGAALFVAGAFLGEEMRQYTTLQAGFGGFYDITTFDRGVARHIDDVVYLFWSITQATDKIVINPPFRAMKVLTLAGGETIIYTVDFKITGEGIAEKANEAYSVHSMAAAKEASARRNESLSSLWQVNVLIVELEDGSCTIRGTVTCRPDGSAHPVRLNAQGLQVAPEEIHPLLIGLLKK